nr:hypothetical protein CFP56_24191 [Quercus suber]
MALGKCHGKGVLVEEVEEIAQETEEQMLFQEVGGDLEEDDGIAVMVKDTILMQKQDVDQPIFDDIGSDLGENGGLNLETEMTSIAPQEIEEDDVPIFFYQPLYDEVSEEIEDMEALHSFKIFLSISRQMKLRKDWSSINIFYSIATIDSIPTMDGGSYAKCRFYRNRSYP